MIKMSDKAFQELQAKSARPLRLVGAENVVQPLSPVPAPKMPEPVMPARVGASLSRLQASFKPRMNSIFAPDPTVRLVHTETPPASVPVSEAITSKYIEEYLAKKKAGMSGFDRRKPYYAVFFLIIMWLATIGLTVAFTAEYVRSTADVVWRVPQTIPGVTEEDEQSFPDTSATQVVPKDHPGRN